MQMRTRHSIRTYQTRWNWIAFVHQTCCSHHIITNFRFFCANEENGCDCLHLMWIRVNTLRTNTTCNNYKKVYIGQIIIKIS